MIFIWMQKAGISLQKGHYGMEVVLAGKERKCNFRSAGEMVLAGGGGKAEI